MEHDFWHERWASGQLGFHQVVPDHILLAHWRDMSVDGGSKVFVPLCGKSLDMIWLREQGYAVVGIELSEQAVGDFFAENALEHSIEERDGFRVYRGDGIDIWCGDFFALPAGAVLGVGAIYDRGSLVALPPEMRLGYARKLQEVLPGVPMFLSCVEYDQTEMGGPPFSISRGEVEQHYGARYDVAQIYEELDREIPERFRERGLTSLASKAYILRPRVRAP